MTYSYTRYKSSINRVKMAAQPVERKDNMSRGDGLSSTAGEGGLQPSAVERGRLAALSPQNANYIVDLMEELQSSTDAEVLDAMAALTECFQLAMEKYPELFTARMMREEVSFGHTPLEKYRGWLLECFHGFNKQLAYSIASDSPKLQEKSLQAAMNVIKCEASTFRVAEGRYKFPSELFGFFVRALLDQDKDMTSLLKVFSDHYLQFADVRVYTLKTIAKVIPVKMGAKNAKVDSYFIDNCYTALKLIQPCMKTAQSEEEGDTWDFFVGHPDGVSREEGSSDVEGDDSGPPKKKTKAQPKGELARVNVASLADHQKWFSEAWLAFLQLPLPSHMYKEILVYLHRDVMPHMPDPRRLIDFLTACCNVGGVISILALNGLFVLIHEYHLDFPDFYSRLYSLLDPALLHARYMQRFFHLLDVFLSSTHLPLYLVAAFVKKLSRLALTAPPHGAIVVVVMVTNLIKRHPNCKVLIHRRAESEGQVEDPFVDLEKDPMKTRALDSSLWELQTLKQHYVPKVADVATRVLSPDQMAKPEEHLGQYLDLSHSELYEEELHNWTNEKEPAMTFGPVVECFPDIIGHTQT